MTHAPAVAAGDETRRQLAGLRVLIAHEWLYAWAGAERCVEQMLHVFPDADLLVGVRTERMRDFNAVTRRAEESWVGRVPGARTKHRWFLPLHALAFARFDTSPYDLVISSSHAFEKFIHWRRGPAQLCYCYSPPRFLWGFLDAYDLRATGAEQLALRAGAAAWRALDRRAAGRVDRFVSISRYIAARVRQAYGVESDVVYPPVAPKAAGNAVEGPRVDASAPAGNGSRAPYLFTIGRLVEYKRTDLLVRAAELLQMRLVIAGDGPERRTLEREAGSHTEFVGNVGEGVAAALLQDCAAFVFGGEEDFGIALVEANAHGRPVVCYGRGGATETMRDGETAVFFQEQTADAVAEAVRACLARRWDASVLRANAARFSPERFREQFADAAARVMRADVPAVP